MNVSHEEKKDERSLYALPDRWILSRLSLVTEEITQALEDYHFNDAAGLCYQFVWHEFCDWYLEMAKQRLYGEEGPKKESTMTLMQTVLAASLKLLHAFMPFVTEEIWEKLPHTEGSVMYAKFPEASDFVRDEEALREMDLLMGVINGIRNIRGEMNLAPSKKVNILIDAADEGEAALFRSNLAYIQTLAKVEAVSIASGVDKPEASATAVYGQNQIHLLLKGLLDFNEERNRLKKQIGKIDKDIEVSGRKLSNRDFLKKAPAEIVAEVKQKVEGLSLKRDKLSQNLKFFETIDE
jgi:valyl-tRNA synthetase